MGMSDRLRSFCRGIRDSFGVDHGAIVPVPRRMPNSFYRDDLLVCLSRERTCRKSYRPRVLLQQLNAKREVSATAALEKDGRSYTVKVGAINTQTGAQSLKYLAAASRRRLWLGRKLQWQPADELGTLHMSLLHNCPIDFLRNISRPFDN
jgi:hypothetical protein